ncbi:MAG: hypothetical protein PUE27_01565 [Sharpea porci]|uniref:hypothetical protein n=1 Tax=Sharpea porci TaxID=2652286 RepID=UPI00240931FD|nr:hypothetical protein [Sharpea porci]MDD6710762.1 hypothetical protein [Sharpea porci]
MKVQGCSNPGFSFTSKYKNATISIYNFVNTKCAPGQYEYQQFQDVLSRETPSKESEVRMLIPFLIKAGIINTDNVIRGGSRIRQLNVNSTFFTNEGKCFVEFLIIEQNKDKLIESQQNIITSIYHKFGLIIYKHLILSEDQIYKDIYDYLQDYNTIDKYEFFLLTDCRSNDHLDKLNDYILNYRSGKIKKDDIEIVKNQNAYQYVISFLNQIGILDKDSSTGSYRLGTLIKEIGV